MPLLLLPGFMLDETLWTDMAPALAPLGPLAYGDISLDTTIPAIARRILANAPSTFTLIGFSLGSYVAREVARQAPDRVTALILIASALTPDTSEQSRQKESAISQMANLPFKGLSQSAIASSLHINLAHNDALISRIRTMNIRLGKDVFMRQARLLRNTDSHELARIHCPTLVIAAADDRLRSVAESRELASGIPHATLHIMPGVGHMIPLEAPAELAKVITTWLQKAPVQAP